MAAGVTVHGADQLARQLEDLAVELPDLVGAAVVDVLAPAVARFAPVRTGRLAGSVSPDADAVTVAAPYAIQVAADNPYVRRAMALAYQTAPARADLAITERLPR